MMTNSSRWAKEMEVNEEKVGKISITLYQNYSKQEQNILVFFLGGGLEMRDVCEWNCMNMFAWMGEVIWKEEGFCYRIQFNDKKKK